MQITSEEINKIEDTVGKICNYFGVSEQDIINNRGTEPIVNARFFSWYILHYHHYYSTNQIAHLYCRTSRNVYCGMRKIRLGIESQPYYKKMYDDLLKILYQ